ncbi:MAG TPA: hypothetical protein VF017_14855 [Thermoanaerobaculia bacterium]|nr:hypothetical protein [Thermoanaerobaculia bacterium]
MSLLERLASLIRRRTSAFRGRAQGVRGHSLTTPCSVCGVPAARMYLWEREGVWYLRFAGLCGMNFASPGPSDQGDPISAERAQAFLAAFGGPDYDTEKIAATGLYDDAGFCRPCGKFYCATHWNISSTGGGTCPAGHFKSLDPHWHPDWDEL